jgi:hypothetical protein
MALLWRTLLTAAGSAVALQRLPCRACARPLMTLSGPVAGTDRAARSARLKEKLAKIKAARGVDQSKPELQELRLDSLSTADWTRIIEEVGPFMKDNRVTKLRDVLEKRRAGLHVVLENIADPHNAAAVLRTSEGLGVQHVRIMPPAPRRCLCACYGVDTLFTARRDWDPPLPPTLFSVTVSV